MKRRTNSSWTSGFGKQAFLSKHGAMIGKCVIEHCCARKLERQLRNKAPLTRVADKPVNIDRYSTMDVPQVMRVFEYRTFCEIASDIAKQLELSMKDIIGVDQFKVNGEVSGYFQALAHQFKTVYIQKLIFKPLNWNLRFLHLNGYLTYTKSIMLY